MNFKEMLNGYAEEINAALAASLDGENLPQKKVFDAMAYSLNGGGKRIRPILVLEFARLAKVSKEKAMPFACAIEMVHTYSLIHDDLPCMDDDALRRGRPTCHIAYDEATAVLAGDGLLNYAYETMLDADVPAETKLNAISALAKASGVYGMIGGQIVDMEGEERALSASELTEMHRMKTGALIRAACEMGAYLGGGDENLLDAARRYADALGRAFQIQDDVLNVIGTAEEMGKDVGNDAESGKSTFVTLNGLDACIKDVNDLTNTAVDAVAGIEGSEFLTELAKSLATRKN
ncbi:MAG: polyprenyl synthetase family protein [Clostridia bacterium]|nr:polyprenyl synthetase family protein [Clostridia bacterium]